jgi:hypothetical protein
MMVEEFTTHLLWSDGDQRGRVGVRLQDARLTLELLAGKALPAGLLLPVLEAVLPPEAWAEAERLHRSRACPWTVEVRVGMSGCRTYRLRALVNADWGFAPIQATVHVSMYGRLNMGIRGLWLGDLAPLLAAVVRDFPPPPADRYTLRKASPYPVEGFREPGTPSGLEELRAAFRVVQALEAEAE